jgi:hypothetical protein
MSLSIVAAFPDGIATVDRGAKMAGRQQSGGRAGTVE